MFWALCKHRLLITLLSFLNWQTLLPNRHIKFSLFPGHSKDSFSFFGFEVTIIMLNESSRRVNVADDLMSSLAFFIRCDHHDDVITETQSLSCIYSLLIGSLFSLAGFVLSAMTSEIFDSFEKPRHGSLSHFI